MPVSKRKILKSINPYLIALRDILEQLSQAAYPEYPSDCSFWEERGEFTKDPSMICNNLDVEGSSASNDGNKDGVDGNRWDEEDGRGALNCFDCVFRHFGLALPIFHGMEIGEQTIRFRAFLGAYLKAEAGLRVIIANMNGCQLPSDFDMSTIPSVIDYILGEGQLKLEYNAVDNLAKTEETTAITIPESQLSFIDFVFAHELGHAFHNRLEETYYRDLRAGENFQPTEEHYIDENGNVVYKVMLQVPAIGEDGKPELDTSGNVKYEVREVKLTEPNQKGAVRDYFASVGGYFTTRREYESDIPIQFLWSAQPLTSLNFYDNGTYFSDVYISSVRPLVLKDIYKGGNFERGKDSEGNEYIYIRRDNNGNGYPVNTPEEATKILEPSSYVPSLQQEEIPNIDHRFPNELRPTAEPKEGFADSFANYILSFTEYEFTGEAENEDNLFLSSKRGQFFDQNMSKWLCYLLGGTMT